MSIIIQFNTASFIPSASLSAKSSCILSARTNLEMVPGIDQTDQTVMTDDESSMVDIATSNTLYTHDVGDLKTTNHVFGTCFGLPYQDHNYGAPPPPTPPSYSPCASPAHANGVPDEDTNLSVVSTSTTNEEIQEGSITRCICGFEHDDEYMICCDRCLVWQHVDCMGLDRNSIPETYLCEKCEPRKVDKHKAKVLQTRKKVAMTDSSDSEEESTNKNAERKHKFRNKRKKKDDEKSEKNEQGSGKRNKQLHKNAKERMEAKRSKLRRAKNKESTSTADEEAQDAWEISLEWCEKNFEPALNNQYTPDVQHLARILPLQGHEQKFMELLLTRHCHIVDKSQKKLISIYDIPRDQPLIEYVGKFLLASQFHELHPIFSRRLFPFVLFYTLDQEEICVDASVYGNEARFIRRSCKPNAEIRHLVHNGNLHLYVASTKAVFKDDEITLPLEFNLKEGIKELDCACKSEDCILKYHQKNGSMDTCQDKRKKGRRSTFSADDDSSHSIGLTSPSKLKSPVKNANEHNDGKSDLETEEQANERKKKTREERKIDAIMRAFDQMEKAAKRRQQALERQKAHHPKSEESSEKQDNSKDTISKDEDKVMTASGSETQGGEEEKIHIATPKPKKGKRRRGSGTSGRRRTRTNSGGSDILPYEENTLQKSPAASTDVVSNIDACVETPIVVTTATAITLSSVSLSSISSPVVLKTKRFLLHEWLQEKSETNTNPSTTSPVPIRTEVKWTTSATSPTCYVQCTKDNPHSGGISAAHLRRSSTSGQIKSFPLKTVSEQGSAKKRWLRQAMYDCNSYDDPLTIDPGVLEGLPLDCGYLSPNYHGEIGSPSAVDDTVTPLKKRRLMRESVESVSSPLSPTVHNTDGTNSKDGKVNNFTFKTETELEDSEQQLSIKVDLPPSSSPISKEHVLCKINGLRIEPIENQNSSCSKEEKIPCDSIMDATFADGSKHSFGILNAASSNCTSDDSSMQNNCDLKEQLCNVKNEYVQSVNLVLAQNICKVNISETDKTPLCTTESMQSNLLTSRNSSPDKTIKSMEYERTLLNNNVKRKINFSFGDLNVLPFAIAEDNLAGSSNCDTSVLKSEISKSDGDGSENVLGAEYLPSVSQTLCQANVHNTLNKNSCIIPVNSKSTKDEFSDSASLNSELHTLASPLENIDIFDDTYKKEQNSTMNFSKSLADIETDSEELCSSDASANNNDAKSAEFSESHSKPSDISINDSNPTLKINCVSATQKRKVSLSEYRLRMKDNSNKRSCTDTIKRSMSSPALSATAIPETLPEQVMLAPLPLFDTTVGSQSPTQTSSKTPKNKETEDEEETYSDLIEHRENLTDRLKREFGLDDDTEGCASLSNQTKSISLTLCAQPPPPPPPRLLRPSQNNMNIVTATSSTQFGFNVPTPYSRTSYIVPQVSSAQFIPVQQTVTTPIIPSIHSITTQTGAQCNVRSSVLPSQHSFAPPLQGSVLQSSIQHEYSPVSAQNFATLVQQPPPPPPKSYSHICQPGLYK